MADNKYGRVFTEGDVEKILEFVQRHDDDPNHITLNDVLPDMDEDGVRFKFEPDEPLFILRGHDGRAVGAIKHYRDHQSPRAPINHLDAIEKALRAFLDYRHDNPQKVREPD